jgi:hypothetical protein
VVRAVHVGVSGNSVKYATTMAIRIGYSVRSAVIQHDASEPQLPITYSAVTLLLFVHDALFADSLQQLLSALNTRSGVLRRDVMLQIPITKCTCV